MGPEELTIAVNALAAMNEAHAHARHRCDVYYDAVQTGAALKGQLLRMHGDGRRPVTGFRFVTQQQPDITAELQKTPTPANCRN